MLYVFWSTVKCCMSDRFLLEQNTQNPAVSVLRLKQVEALKTRNKQNKKLLTLHEFANTGSGSPVVSARPTSL